VRYAVFLALISILTGCSTSPLNRQDLHQAATQIESISQEAALFSEFVRDGHATKTFMRTHPDYLKELSGDVAKTLSERSAENGLSQDQTTLQMLTSRLQDRIAEFPVIIQDSSSLDERRNQFLKIADEAKRTRERL
jgi:hypothetical protein